MKWVNRAQNPKYLHVKVYTYETELEFQLSFKTTGKNLFDMVCSSIDLQEETFFGLENYYNNTNGQMEFTTWLKMEKRISVQKLTYSPLKQLKFLLHPRYFPEDFERELIQPLTRHLFYLDVKNTLFRQQSVRLSSHAVGLENNQNQNMVINLNNNGGSVEIGSKRNGASSPPRLIHRLGSSSLGNSSAQDKLSEEGQIDLDDGGSSSRSNNPPSDVAILLASLSAQAEYGDLSETEVQDEEDNMFLPGRMLQLLPSGLLMQCQLSQDVCRRFRQCYKSHKCMTKEDAELAYLKIAHLYRLFGIEYFIITDKMNCTSWLGVSAEGISVYPLDNKTQPIHNYSWKSIKNVSYKDKKFTIKLTSPCPNHHINDNSPGTCCVQQQIPNNSNPHHSNSNNTNLTTGVATTTTTGASSTPPVIITDPSLLSSLTLSTTHLSASAASPSLVCVPSPSQHQENPTNSTSSITTAPAVSTTSPSSITNNTKSHICAGGEIMARNTVRGGGGSGSRGAVSAGGGSSAAIGGSSPPTTPHSYDIILKSLTKPSPSNTNNNNNTNPTTLTTTTATTNTLSTMATGLVLPSTPNEDSSNSPGISPSQLPPQSTTPTIITTQSNLLTFHSNHHHHHHLHLHNPYNTGKLEIWLQTNQQTRQLMKMCRGNSDLFILRRQPESRHVIQMRLKACSERARRDIEEARLNRAQAEREAALEAKAALEDKVAELEAALESCKTAGQLLAEKARYAQQEAALHEEQVAELTRLCINQQHHQHQQHQQPPSGSQAAQTMKSPHQSAQSVRGAVSGNLISLDNRTSSHQSQMTTATAAIINSANSQNPANNASLPSLRAGSTTNTQQLQSVYSHSYLHQHTSPHNCHPHHHHYPGIDKKVPGTDPIPRRYFPNQQMLQSNNGINVNNANGHIASGGVNKHLSFGQLFHNINGDMDNIGGLGPNPDKYMNNFGLGSATKPAGHMGNNLAAELETELQREKSRFSLLQTRFLAELRDTYMQLETVQNNERADSASVHQSQLRPPDPSILTGPVAAGTKLTPLSARYHYVNEDNSHKYPAVSNNGNNMPNYRSAFHNNAAASQLGCRGEYMWLDNSYPQPHAMTNLPDYLDGSPQFAGIPRTIPQYTGSQKPNNEAPMDPNTAVNCHPLSTVIHSQMPPPNYLANNHMINNTMGIIDSQGFGNGVEVPQQQHTWINDTPMMRKRVLGPLPQYYEMGGYMVNTTT